MLRGEPFTKWKLLCSRDVNKCVIIAGACLKWQGKDCLQTTASKKQLFTEQGRHFNRACQICHFQLLFLQLMLSDALF